MAAKSSLKNMALCLTGVCLVCSAILALVYDGTYAKISETAQKAQAEAIGKVMPEGCTVGSKMQTDFKGAKMTFFPAIVNGKIIGYAVESSANGFGGRIVLMVGVLNDGTIFNTSVLEAGGETPGLGAKCTTDSKFIEQWRGFGADKKLAVKKDGGDVDAITAATITSRAYTRAVAAAREFVLVKGGQDNE